MNPKMTKPSENSEGFCYGKGCIYLRDFDKMRINLLAPLCKGGSREAGGGLSFFAFEPTLTVNSKTIPPSFACGEIHLPLHKGGFCAPLVGANF